MIMAHIPVLFFSAYPLHLPVTNTPTAPKEKMN